MTLIVSPLPFFICVSERPHASTRTRTPPSLPLTSISPHECRHVCTVTTPFAQLRLISPLFQMLGPLSVPDPSV